MKFSYFHFRWQWCLHNSRSNHWSNYCTVTSHYHHHLLFCDKERYVCCKCVLHVFNICINITIIFVQYCITVEVEVTVHCLLYHSQWKTLAVSHLPLFHEKTFTVTSFYTFIYSHAKISQKTSCKVIYETLKSFSP